MKNKHAYLITAHDNLYILERLIELLDDERNDLYIHLDIKCSIKSGWFEKVKNTKYSHVEFIERQNVKWGGYSLTNVEINLLESASKKNYAWYHLISGTSLPIKTQNEIHDYFDKESNEKLYFHINYDPHKRIQDRARAYYPFIETKYYRKCKPLKALSILIGKIEILFGVDRLKNNELSPLYNGWEWFSVPHDFAIYAVSKRNLIEHTFKYTLAADEVWIQSIAIHSEKFNDRIYGFNGKDDPIDASKHFQDWERGKPYVFRKDDYELLMNDNPAFWARKFDVGVDKEIIDMICDTILRRTL
jgi:hypothetical protein